MKTHAQAVIIGGGVIGCSVLYHLTKLGWRDVVLCERKELTAGSSWHAAGGFHALNSDPGVSRLQSYTIDLYREIEALSGQDVGLHFTGGLNIAATPERWEFLQADHARHRVLGLKTELVGPAQIRELCPLIDASGVLGGVYDPREGHLDPYGATHAYAKAAVKQGATVYRHTRVLELNPTERGTWQVVTDQGNIEAEHVVNAAGLWAREVGYMVGARLPLIPMEHHYLLTDDLPELAQSGREIPLVLDLDGEIYLRQERKGVLLGVYEKDATPWALKGTPWEYGDTELLPPALERLEEALEKGFQRFPSLPHAGIRRIVNGPFTFTPDGNPLVGPVPGLKNYWAACGVMAGFAQGGGVGLALSQWMTRGEPDSDIFAMDVARFGPYASENYTIEKAREFYARRFQIAYPNEYWPAGRPAKTSSIHAELMAENAVFGVSYGLEIPLYFARKGESAIETPALGRSNAFARVKEECLASRNAVGVIDISAFGKYLISGKHAEAALNRVLAGRLPDVGQIRITPMLTTTGKLKGDLTTLRLAKDRFLVSGSGYLQSYHMRWFDEHLAGDGVHVQNISEQSAGLAIFGPRSRELLQRLTKADLANDALPFMNLVETSVALAPAIIARLSVSGELGYEIHVGTQYLRSLLNAVMRSGTDLGARHVGMYALNCLRLEKSFGIWSREFSSDYTPRMAGLERFIDFRRSQFIGRDAALEEREREPVRRLVTLEVDAVEADATGYEPILLADQLVGFVTSGGYGHCVDRSLAMGYLDCAVPANQSGLTITINGTERRCRPVASSPWDPSGSRMRG